MKKTLLFAFTSCLLFAGLLAQTVPVSKIPALVQAGFSKNYPTVTKLKWDKEDKDFEASFSLENRKISVLLNAKGDILETEEEVSKNAIPPAAIEYVQKMYPKSSIKETAKITKQSGEVVFEVEVKGKDLLFDAKGNILTNKKG